MLGNSNWISPFFGGMLRALTNFGQYKLDFTSFFEGMLRALTNIGQ